MVTGAPNPLKLGQREPAPARGVKKPRKGRANVREPSVGIVDPRLTDHPSENVGIKSRPLDRCGNEFCDESIYEQPMAPE